MDPGEVRLLAEQVSHTLDLLNGQISALEARLSHAEEVADLRLSTLERSQSDQEARLRVPMPRKWPTCASAPLSAASLTRRPACGRLPTRWCA